MDIKSCVALSILGLVFVPTILIIIILSIQTMIEMHSDTIEERMREKYSNIFTLWVNFYKQQLDLWDYSIYNIDLLRKQLEAIKELECSATNAELQAYSKEVQELSTKIEEAKPMSKALETKVVNEYKKFLFQIILTVEPKDIMWFSKKGYLKYVKDVRKIEEIDKMFGEN